MSNLRRGIFCDETQITHTSSATISMFTLPNEMFVDRTVIIVDEAFNGTTPTLTIGIVGSTSKYLASTDVDLKTTGRYEVQLSNTPSSEEDVIAIFSASGSTTGEARLQLHYVNVM